MISAQSYKPDIDRAKEMGADDYVVKPFYPDELVVARGAPEGRPGRSPARRDLLGHARLDRRPRPRHDAVRGNTACVELRSGRTS